MSQAIQKAAGFGEVSVSKAATLLFYLFVISDVFQGLLRYGLSKVGAAPLIYLPKAALLIFPLYALIAQARAPAAYLLFFTIFVWSLAVGYFDLPTIFQGFFGVWVLVPLLYGCWAAGPVLRQAEEWRSFIIVVLLCSIAGVLVNSRITFPWAGQSLNIGGVTVLAAKDVTDYGISRVGGFAIAAFTAAAQILTLGTWVMVYSEVSPFTVFLWLACGVAIVLTTTKGLMISYILLTGYFITRRRIANALGGRLAWCGVLYAFLLADICVPLYDFVHPLVLNFHSFVQRFLLESFGDRLGYTWPGSVDLLTNWGQWITGRGVGGLGDAQVIFEPQKEMPGDNICVYLTVELGLVFALVFLFYFTTRAALDFLNRRAHPLVFPFTLLVISYGLVTPIVNFPILGLIVGLVFGSIFRVDSIEQGPP